MISKPILVEMRGDVALLTLQHGKANAIDIELLEALTNGLLQLEASGCGAAVLTGEGHIFSAGVDLFKVLAGGVEYLRDFLPALVRSFEILYSSPLSVVAAVNGHAVAAGCVLACACDRRLMASGPGRIGLTELLVGVPYPAIAVEIVRAAVGSSHANEVLLLGKTYDPGRAAELGLIDDEVNPSSLLGAALEVALSLGAIPRASFRMTKRQLREPVFQLIDRLGPHWDEEVFAQWGSPEVRRAMNAYAERLTRD